jgi:type IV pilus assembly protein PilN
MRLTINLASRPYVDIAPLIARLRIALMIVGGLTVCLMLVFCISWRGETTIRLEGALLDKTLTQDSNDLRHYRDMLQKPDSVLLAARTAALNRLLDEKAFSWTLLMRDLEGLIPSQLQISTMQPVRAKDGRITVQMHIIGPRQHVIEFLEHLEASTRFGSPRIVRESTHTDSHGSDSVIGLSDASMEEFEIETGYGPDQSTQSLSKNDPASALHSTSSLLPSEAPTTQAPLGSPHEAAARDPLVRREGK